MVLAAHPPPFVSRDSPVVQCLATRGFRLLAVVVTDTSACRWGDRLYVGPGVWDRVVGIEQCLSHQWLTTEVQQVLWPTVAAMIRHDEARFIEAFNTTILDDIDAHPLTLLTALECDCREAIMAERTQRRFADFEDLTTRVACCDNPHELLVERVITELRVGDDGYRWLTA
jgi:predicted nucleic acid-binding OB-fold protein